MAEQPKKPGEKPAQVGKRDLIIEASAEMSKVGEKMIMWRAVCSHYQALSAQLQNPPKDKSGGAVVPSIPYMEFTVPVNGGPGVDTRAVRAVMDFRRMDLLTPGELSNLLVIVANYAARAWTEARDRQAELLKIVDTETAKEDADQSVPAAKPVQ